jgi:DNA-binding transcriptional regulator GbsR (MarR family)
VYDVGVATPDETALADRPDRDEVLRYVERFAMALADLGMQRMPARVFAYVLTDDAERFTAAELASALRVSPAAISGAVRTLVSARLLGREREPGERVDTYRVYDMDLWYTIILQRDQVLDQFLRLAAEGVELLGRDTPGGHRMRETYEFYRFLHGKVASLLDEWQEHKRRVLG